MIVKRCTGVVVKYRYVNGRQWLGSGETRSVD